MIRFKILVVVYNRSPLASETIQSLLNIKKVIAAFSEIIIWDNSKALISETEKKNMESAFEGLNFSYHADGQNTYLSIIYNKIIRTLRGDEFLVIFDHDSKIELKFFDELNKAISNNPDINLFLPLIYSQQKLVSPASLKYFRGAYWQQKKVGVIESKNIHAINSGMTISGEYLKNKYVGYNENLKFYGTDNDFMIKYAQDNQNLCVLDTDIVHILNFHDEGSVDDKLSRFLAMREGSLINMKYHGWMIFVITKIYFVALGLKFVLRYKDLRFVFKQK